MEASLAALSGATDLRPAVAVTDPPTEVERRRSALQFTRRPSAAGLGCFGVLGVALGDRVDGPCQNAGESFGFQEESEVVTQLNCRSASYTKSCYFGVPGDCSPGTEAGPMKKCRYCTFMHSTWSSSSCMFTPCEGHSTWKIDVLVHSRQTIVIHFISAMLEIEALQHLVVDLFLVRRVVGSAVLPARLYSSLNNQTRTLVARRECDAQLGNRWFLLTTSRTHRMGVR